MISLIALTTVAFTTPARPAGTVRTSPVAMIQPGSSWNEWSLSEVGTLDAAVLAVAVGGVFVASSRSDDKLSSDEVPVRGDPNELPGLFDGSTRRRSRGRTPRMGLDDGRFNRRNMSIDERRAFDALMKKREEDAKTRNLAIVAALLIGGVYLGLNPGLIASGTATVYGCAAQPAGP